MCKGWPPVVAGDREGTSQSQLWDRSRQDHTIQEKPNQTHSHDHTHRCDLLRGKETNYNFY